MFCVVQVSFPKTKLSTSLPLSNNFPPLRFQSQTCQRHSPTVHLYRPTTYLPTTPCGLATLPCLTQHPPLPTLLPARCPHLQLLPSHRPSPRRTLEETSLHEVEEVDARTCARVRKIRGEKSYRKCRLHVARAEQGETRNKGSGGTILYGVTITRTVTFCLVTFVPSYLLSFEAGS